MRQLRRTMPNMMAPQTHEHAMSSCMQQALWVLILIVHVLVGMISLLFAVIYLTLLLKSTWAKQVLPIVGLHFSASVTVAAVVLSSVCGIAHITQAARVLCANCTAQRPRVRATHPAPPIPVISVQSPGRRKHPSNALQPVILRIMASISIQGRHFDTFFLAREVVTVALQTYLCHHLAISIVKEGTRNATTALLVFNCLSTPVIHVVGHRWDVLTRRLVCLVVDAVIDLTSSLIMPIMICLPYFQLFLKISPTVQSGLGHDPIYIAAARQELGIATATSPATCAMVYIPALTLMFGLSDIKALLLNVRSSPKRRHRDSAHRRRQPHSAKYQRFTHLLMMLYGVVIATVMMAARTSGRQETLSVCQVRLHPWSPQRVACGVVVIDCNREEIDGSADEIRLRLEEYDLDTVEVVTLAHCSRLEMPSTMQKLRKLLVLEVFNSTLAAWDQQAEISYNSHPEIMTVLLLDLNLTMLGDKIPVGLLGDSIPETLSSLVVSDTYLREIPLDFHVKWKQNLVNLQFNSCGLKSLPNGFSELQASLKICLSGNNLTSMSRDFFESKSIRILNINNNPIQLPDTGSVSGLSLLAAQDTRIKEIPAWVLAAAPSLIVGAHSPFCKNQPGSRLLKKTNFTCEETDGNLYRFDVADWSQRRGLS